MPGEQATPRPPSSCSTFTKTRTRKGKVTARMRGDEKDRKFSTRWSPLGAEHGPQPSFYNRRFTTAYVGLRPLHLGSGVGGGEGRQMRENVCLPRV